MSPAFSDEARRLYEEARRGKKAWKRWSELPAMVRQAWALAFFLASLTASNRAATPNKVQRKAEKRAPVRDNQGSQGAKPDQALMKALEDGG